MKVEHPKPSARVLSFILRHRELWPDRFKTWDFSCSDTCAVGMAHRLWPQQFESDDSGEINSVASVLGLPPDIFKLGGSYERRGPVTPEVVADRIDAFLAKAQA